ncbi:MAG: carboxysome shell protein [Roseibacillus sp.]|nr:carboxysome shell protein [Roseibacillus sp.]|tara:strand:+ start:5615 stop:5914 length:300 start_codon:yes stop_codon:yes gene_type:complete
MGKQAVGLLETRGLCCLVSGVDAALKAASVELTGPMRSIGSGLCNAVVTGDVAAVKAAIDAGADTAASLGEVVTAHVIARPDEAIDPVIVSEKPSSKAK